MMTRMIHALGSPFPTMLVCAAGGAFAAEAERWGQCEVTLAGPSDGNPYVQVTLSAAFTQGGRRLDVPGFYDGDGVYKIRFGPPTVGEWCYQTHSNRSELDGKTGAFTVSPASPGNHGPVQVHKTFYLRYADATPYFQIGTTCYAWIHQTPELQQRTLETLATSPFNKIRFCVFPKSYTYNQNEPELFAFRRKADGTFDFDRPDPAFWHHLEQRILDLQRLGIEADLILWHPYDRWGFSEMSKDRDDRYLRYCIARLAAYRNVWWSLANEYDLMAPAAMKNHRGNKEMADWDRFFAILQQEDPFARLRGIHNCRGFYDHSKPWVTHCSIQSSDFDHMPEWRERYRKPVVYDECRYEGNVPQGWGNLDAREMTRRFWLGTIGGCYVGHGETYKHPEDILWWSKGGVLHGESPARIAFLKKVISEAPPFEELVPQPDPTPGVKVLGEAGKGCLMYFDQAVAASISLAGDAAYKLDAIDTWAMTVVPLGSAEPGAFSFMAPCRGFLVRLMPYAPGEAPRPEVRATAEPTEGVPPLTVRFAGGGGATYEWDFGDGTQSTEANPEHTYGVPGLYRAILTVTDAAGLSSCAFLTVAVDHDPAEPLVRVGVADGERPAVTLKGEIARSPDGSFLLGQAEPWRWIRVGEGPLPDLEGLRSFTILGWAEPSSLTVGSGGNRIAFNLNYNHSGFDLVHLADGRLRLTVNEWPDGVDNDSSPGKLRIGEWVFFAVTYDATRGADNVSWYFGTTGTPAELDRTSSYNRGAIGTGSGPLTVGNYNETIHKHGLDRQFRGELRGIQIFGSRISSRGALPLGRIKQVQLAGTETRRMTKPGADE